jgi:hypothetical protein
MELVATYELGGNALAFKMYYAGQAAQSSCTFAVGLCMTSKEQDCVLEYLELEY